MNDSERLKRSWVTRRKNGNDRAWNKLDCPDIKKLEDLYITQRQSTRKVGEYFGVTQIVIIRWMKEANIPRRTHKENIMPTAKGSKLLEAHRQAISKSSIGKAPTISGKIHWNYQGGITPINKVLRNSKEYKAWRTAVFTRDNYTCQLCSKTKCYVEADHIKPFSQYPELRFDIDNGRTLCKDCHKLYGWQFFKEMNPRKDVSI